LAGVACGFLAVTLGRRRSRADEILEGLCRQFSTSADRVIMDRTGLTDTYDGLYRGRVMAPSEAEDTRALYFAKTPVS
jgi:hypothetical protein